MAGAFSATAGGQILVMVGIMELTVSVTVITCSLLAVEAPGAAMVILPVYAAVCGESPVGSTAIIKLIWEPGSRTPPAGLTVSHGAPATVAENETGDPLVATIRLCVAGGAGGALKASDDVDTETMGSALFTTNVTGTFTTAATPITVMAMFAV